MDKKKGKYITIRVKGITLITLVVTIIIMLILASITLTLTLGDNGLLGRAKNVTEKWGEASTNEQVELNNLYAELASATSSGINIEEMSDLIEQIVDAKTKELQEQVNAKDTTPAGTVISYIAGTEAPEGYLKCDGAVYNIEDYPSLAEAINTGLGSYKYYGGDGTTTFAVPNLQGEFLRGYSTSSTASKYSGIETTAVGVHQDGTLVNNNFVYTHDYSYRDVLWPTNDFGRGSSNYDIGLYQTYTYSVGSLNPGKTSDTNARWGQIMVRPTNSSVLYCIKY